MWNSIVPTREWVESNVPSFLQESMNARHQDVIDFLCDGSQAQEVEQSVLQAYYTILAGACLSLGIRYAGCCNSFATDTLLSYYRFFTKLELQNGKHGCDNYDLQ
jgi:anaphase-promoting complex subunit 1